MPKIDFLQTDDNLRIYIWLVLVTDLIKDSYEQRKNAIKLKNIHAREWEKDCKDTIEE